MGEIITTSIGTLRYAPAGSEQILAYNYNGAEGLTLARLIMAFAFRRAVQNELSCVVAMNRLSIETDRLDDLSGCARYVVTGGTDTSGGKWANWDQVSACLRKVNSAIQLPATFGPGTPYTEKMAIYEEIRTMLTNCNVANEKLGLDLQTAVSRRDITYNLSTSTIASLGKSTRVSAAQLK